MFILLTVTHIWNGTQFVCTPHPIKSRISPNEIAFYAASNDARYTHLEFIHKPAMLITESCEEVDALILGKSPRAAKVLFGNAPTQT